MGDKADRMGISASVDPRLAGALEPIANNANHLILQGERRINGKVHKVRDRLVLRPSNGVVEASDYLSHKHDWVQMEEEVTPPIRRALWVPRVSCGAAAEL